MFASLKSLLEGVFDYAGLFPPARLDMARSVENYVNYIQGQDQWIVNRFVCPSSRLTELSKAIDQRQFTPELPITVIGQLTTDYDEWGFALEHDAKSMTAFVDSVGEQASLDAYEIRVPGHIHAESCVADLSAFDQLDVYIELPLSDGLEDSLEAIAISEWIGAKARTGGMESSDFPGAEAIAAFIHGAIALDVPFKLTAGLHHPLPGVDEISGGRMHGFLNVLTASALALTHDMSRKEIVDVLRCDTIRDWNFGDDRFSWRGHEVTEAQIDQVRGIFVGIGSCSIAEPLADLASLRLL